MIIFGNCSRNPSGVVSEALMWLSGLSQPDAADPVAHHREMSLPMPALLKWCWALLWLRVVTMPHKCAKGPKRLNGMIEAADGPRLMVYLRKPSVLRNAEGA